MSKYTDYYKQRCNIFKENKAALYEEADELKELHAMLKAGLSEQQKADLDLIIDGGAAVPSGVGEKEQELSWPERINLLSKSDLDDYFDSVEKAFELLPESHREQLNQLVNGPVWAGDIMSKSQRGDLFDAGLAVQTCVSGEEGFTGASYFGYSVSKLIPENVAVPQEGEHIIEKHSVSEEVEGNEDASNSNQLDHSGSADVSGNNNGSNSPDSGPDRGETGPEEITRQQFVVNDVVECIYEDDSFVAEVVGFVEGDDSLMQIQTGPISLPHTYPKADARLIHHTDVPCPGDGWKRNLGVMPEGEVEDVVLTNGEQAKDCWPALFTRWDYGSHQPNDIAWYKPKETVKDVADEQETIVEGSQEKSAEEDQAEEIEDNEQPLPPSGSTNRSESPNNGDTVSDGSDAVHVARDDSAGSVGGASTALASWIIEQEWRWEGEYLTVRKITAVTQDNVHFEAVIGDCEMEVREFLNSHIPKGWERYWKATTKQGLNYDFVEPTGEVWINQPYQDLMDVANAVHVLFIREHQPESKDDEQDSARMGPDNFQTREFVGTGPSIPIGEFDESEQKAFVEENVTGQDAVELVKSVREERKKVDEQEADPANSTIPSATYTATVVGFTGDVCDDAPTNSERVDVGRDQEPSGVDGESIPAEYDDEITKEQHEKIVADTEQYQDQSQYQIVSGEPWNEKEAEDNGLEYLIKEQATELTEAEQKAVDLIEGRVGDELDKLEGVE